MLILQTCLIYYKSFAIVKGLFLRRNVNQRYKAWLYFFQQANQINKRKTSTKQLLEYYAILKRCFYLAAKKLSQPNVCFTINKMCNITELGVKSMIKDPQFWSSFFSVNMFSGLLINLFVLEWYYLLSTAEKLTDSHWSEASGTLGLWYSQMEYVVRLKKIGLGRRRGRWRLESTRLFGSVNQHN